MLAAIFLGGLAAAPGEPVFCVLATTKPAIELEELKLAKTLIEAALPQGIHEVDDLRLLMDRRSHDFDSEEVRLRQVQGRVHRETNAAH